MDGTAEAVGWTQTDTVQLALRPCHRLLAALVAGRKSDSAYPREAEAGNGTGTGSASQSSRSKEVSTCASRPPAPADSTDIGHGAGGMRYRRVVGDSDRGNWRYCWLPGHTSHNGKRMSANRNGLSTMTRRRVAFPPIDCSVRSPDVRRLNVPSRLFVGAVGLLLIGLSMNGVRTGSVPGRIGSVQRVSNPLRCWFRVTLYFGVGVLAVCYAWLRDA
jgi:hypothetical protein